MARIHRLRTTDRIFFVTSRILPDVPPFGNPEFEILIDVLSLKRKHLGFLLCGYVLMPDHWHAAIWPQYPLTISRVLHDVKRSATQNLNTHYNRRGSLWQSAFFDRFVRNAKEFHKRMEYMHLNPVRKGLVTSPDQWRWSSYNNFSLDSPVVAACPIQIDYIHLSDEYRG